MATHDYVIDNSTGANVRSDLNSVLQAILSNNSSSSAPSTTAAYMWWADTNTGILKIRNSANNAWVELLQLDGTLTLEDGSASTPGLAFRDDLNTGIFSSDADHFNIATGGTERVKFGTTGVAFNDGGADYDFRIESDTNVNCFTLDAGKSSIGINKDPTTGYGLDILGVSGYEDIFRITAVGTNIGPRINLTPTGTGINRINATANNLQLQQGGNAALTINTSQNVGIGVTSPAAKVHIVGSELRHENSSIPFIRLKSTNAPGSNNFDIGRILFDSAGVTTGILDFKRQGATDDSYFTIFGKQSATDIQERIRVTSKGCLYVHAGQQTNLTNMNKDDHSMPKFFENTTGQDNNLVAGVLHFKSIVRGTSGTNDTLFTFEGGSNCGFFCEITAYFSSAITDFQGRQRMWWRATRSGNNNFSVTQAHNYDKVGTATNVYFNPIWTSSGSGANQVLGVNVQSTGMGAYVRFVLIARIIAHDSIRSMTINR